MFLSREIDIKLCQIYIKNIDIYIYNSGFKRIIFSKYTTNLINDDIPEYPKKLRLASITI